MPDDPRLMSDEDIKNELDYFALANKLIADREARIEREKVIKHSFHEVCEGARKLLAKLDEIEAHPSYLGTFQLAQIHGMEYSGPDCKKEKDMMRFLLGEEKS